MSKSVHGHDVLNFMLEKGGGFTQESLKNAVIEHFGVEARFHTCSTQGMTAEQLITFLKAKGKFVAVDDGFNTQAEKICKH